MGRPDATSSTVQFDPPLAAAGGAPVTMTITLRDFQDAPITAAIQSITVQHAGDSDGLTTIASVVDLGGSVYTVELTGATGVGTDRFTIVVDDGTRPVTLMPNPGLTVIAPAIPTVSTWGFTALALAIFAAATLAFARRYQVPSE